MEKQNKDWENRIRQILANVREEDKARKVTNLIRQLLVQKEKEVREELKKKVEEKKRLKQMWNTDSPSWERMETDRLIYNQALDDILNLLKD